MDPNSYHLYLAHQAEHPVQLLRSQRLRDAEQAAAAQPKRQITLAVRAWISATLIVASDRTRENLTVKRALAGPIR